MSKDVLYITDLIREHFDECIWKRGVPDWGWINAVIQDAINEETDNAILRERAGVGAEKPAPQETDK